MIIKAGDCGGVGKRGLEPLRLAALDPKSSLSANSSTSPNGLRARIIYRRNDHVNSRCYNGTKNREIFWDELSTSTVLAKNVTRL